MEILAEVVVGKVLDTAGQLVANEVALVMNCTKDIKWLQNKFGEINCFLSEADEEHSGQKKSIKKWLQNVRDVAWQAEDILEEFAVECKYGNITQSCVLSCCNQLIIRHKFWRRIQGIKTSISSLTEDGKQLFIFHAVVSSPVEEAESSSTSERVNLRRSSLLPSDSHPVGIQTKLDHIISLLDIPSVAVIAVVGKGGLGKTYLLQHIYNTRKERYEISIWLSVSLSYSVSKLQYDLASELGLSEQIVGGRVSEQRAAQLIRGRLEGKRSLIVLDDVWTATREHDLLARLGLPTGYNSQCKIVVTTRNREVGLNLDAKIYEMECLSDQESWKLFCVYAFGEGSRSPEYLEDVAAKIVEECRNLPLAIKTIAASLACSTLLSKWEDKLRQVKHVVTPNDAIVGVLKLSYDTLSARLKACFAYLSFFSEDEKIDCEYLINLWIAEGFIPEGEEQCNIAWDCLYQLVNLCLVEVWEEKEEFDDILTKYCKVHDLLLDLAICISRENKCAFSVLEACAKDPSRSGDWCRILLAKKNIDDDAISQSRPFSSRILRTLSLCSNSFLTDIPANFFNTIPVLRVLDLSYTRISSLPDSVGKMKLLKVLNLKGTSITEVPHCVRKLKSLWFLDICSTPVRRLPVWIGELKCLQHLVCAYLDCMPKEISNLDSLHTLRSHYLQLSIEEGELSIEEGALLRLEDVAKMTQLREIKFEVKHEVDMTTMAEGISMLVKMRRLGIRNVIGGIRGDTESVLPQFPDEMNAMAHLERLELCNFAVPRWICCFQNLTELLLFGCHCSNYPELQKMPSLVHLRLEHNKSCRELPKEFAQSTGFPHLRFLHIKRFPLLEELPELEDGAMARLEKLQLLFCGRLKKVEGLELLKRLKHFDLKFTGSKEFTESFKEGGENWTKLRVFNPLVIITASNF